MNDMVQGSYQNCIWCGASLKGNENKKFCNADHKNAFHNEKRKRDAVFISRILNTLKRNRHILLSELGESDVVHVKWQKLKDKGFVERFHTHTRRNSGNERVYLFCFECGFCDSGKNWVTIVRESE